MKHYHSPIGLHPFQADGTAKAYFTPSAICTWETGLGKAVSVDTGILTPTGVRKAGEIVVGDLLIGRDGLPTPVVGVYPQGKRQLWSITFDDGARVLADADHQWIVARWRRTPGGRQQDVFDLREEIVTTAEMAAQGVRRGARWAWRIPLARPVEFERRALPIDPYTLGAWLGDGHFGKGRVEFTSVDPEIVEGMVFPPGARVNHRTERTWLIYGCQDQIQSLGLSGTHSWSKFIPEDYLWSSPEDRMALLQGLLDTDGSVKSSTGAEFSSASRTLSEQVRWLVLSLGGRASITERATQYTYRGERRSGRTSYRVSIALPDNPFRLRRKASAYAARTKYPVTHRTIVSIEPAGIDEAVCFAVEAEHHTYLLEDFVVTHNTHLAMALSCLLIEDGEVDLVLVLAEKNKVEDWIEDFQTFTDLPTCGYLGPKRSFPDGGVVVSTYESLLRDALSETKRSVELTELGNRIALLRVLVIFDESVVKLRRRTSGLYKRTEALLRAIRKQGSLRSLHLTATPVESSPENFFNLYRLVKPGELTVEAFERSYVLYRDALDRPRFTNLGPDDHYNPNVPSFRDVVRPILIHKSKSDEDVRDLFPEMTETFEYVPMSDVHREFYEAVIDFGASQDDRKVQRMVSTLRLAAAWPEALMAAESATSQEIAGIVGPVGLRALGSGKADRAVQLVLEAVGRGESVVVFTFFGQTLLPLLRQRFKDVGLHVVVNHGQMTAKARKQAEREFRSTPRSVFLSSDAGARGLNLPEATFLLNFELPLTHANYIQRSNRISRINSKAERVQVTSLIVPDTIEDGIVKMFHQRNVWHDTLLEDTDEGQGWITAEDRQRLLLWGRIASKLS